MAEFEHFLYHRVLVMEIPMPLYLRKDLLIVLLLGILSGLTLPLTASNLGVLLLDHGLNMTTIGIFTMVGLPYSFKFLWSPLVDGMHLPFFEKKIGMRRAQLLAISLVTTASIILLGITNPDKHLALVAIYAFFLAFCAATQDIVIDAMRIEMLDADKQVAGGSMSVTGYRIGMLFSSAGGLYLSASIEWSEIYIIFAIVHIVMALMVVTLAPRIHEASVIKRISVVEKLKIFSDPLREIFTRKNLLWILVFIIFYKLSDAVILSLTTPFFLTLGFERETLVYVVKTYGVFATIFGVMVGGWLAARMDRRNFLFLGLMLQMSSNASYLLLFYTGADITTLYFVVTLENVCSGISTAALVGYLSLLVNKKFTASQYAMLSSFASFGRTFLSSGSGFLVDNYGWLFFVCISIIGSLPALLVYKKATEKKCFKF